MQQQEWGEDRIFEKYGTYILPIRFKTENKTITCWLPLTNMEPKNKKIKHGNKLTVRKTQKSRGNYYGTNTGDSFHVFAYKQENLWKDKNDGFHYHISHLCHHWWCCRSLHLVQEPAWVNIFRKDCTATVDGKMPCDCTELRHERFKEKIKPCIWFPDSTLKNVNTFLDVQFLKDIINKNASRFKNSADDVYNEIISVLGSK